MIYGHTISRSDNGGRMEIYDDDEFVGNLEYIAMPPVGYISFSPKIGKPGAMEVDVNWWLSTSLDYRKAEVENLIRDCIHFPSPPCPMSAS